jgi:hypothetical protein
MAASKPALTDIPGLVTLLYRADWTQLCLSATLSARAERPRMTRMKPGEDGWQRAHDADEADQEDPRENWRLAAEEDEDEDDEDGLPHWREGLSRVLIAPGGRCRVENVAPGSDGFATVCDGETWWLIAPDEATGLHELPLQAGIAELLDPSWLLGGFDLQLIGPAEAAGRPAWQVVATPRPLTTDTALDRDRRIDRADVLVDVELGILLRREAFSGDKQVELAEVRSLILDPAEAGDPGQFRPPPGLPRTQVQSNPFSYLDTSGPGWRIAKTGARAAGAALTFAVRHTGQHPAPASAAPPMPEPGRPPAPGGHAGVSDDLVNLLHRTGLPPQRFAAGVRKWSDGELLFRHLAEVRARSRWSGVLGPDSLWDAIGDRPHQAKFQTVRLGVAMPDRYRIDYLSGDWNERVSARDGDRQWTVLANHVVTFPAKPLTQDWARLADPAWLLTSCWQLSAGAAEDVGGRRGWRIWAKSEPGRRETGDSANLFARAVATVDAELGILLRLAFLVDDRPAVCFELHDVTVPPAGDPDEFRVEIPPGTRVVESTSPFALIDVPAPLQAAWTVGKAGLAGASAVAGWLQKHQGRHGERTGHEPGS